MPLWFMQVQALYPMCLVFLICNVEANAEEDNEEIIEPAKVDVIDPEQVDKNKDK